MTKGFRIGLFIVVNFCLAGYATGWIEYQCPFLRFLDIHCITCGTTRACHALSSGEVISAFLFNPLVFLWIFVATLSYIDFAAISLLNRNSQLFRRFVLFIQNNKRLQLLFVLTCLLNLCYVNGLLTTVHPLTSQ